MNFVTKEPINKGWSSDKKYCVTDENGTRYLLRVSDIAQHDTKQSEFNMMKQVASFGVPMCQPIEFGTCDEGVYSIQSWIDGDDAEEIMSAQSDTEQYIHVNNIMSYILPFSCFESKEQYNEFFEFIKTKCSNIDIY